MTTDLTNEDVDEIANDGRRNAAGGIYATSVHDFARACIAADRAKRAEALAGLPGMLDGPAIREIFLAHGFEIKPGYDDLKPYVYDAARALIAAALAGREGAVPSDRALFRKMLEHLHSLDAGKSLGWHLGCGLAGEVTEIALAAQPAPAESVDVSGDLPIPAPNFAAVRDKRMSDLTPAQQEDAHELWLRENVGWMTGYHQEHYQFLFKRLDEARSKS